MNYKRGEGKYYKDNPESVWKRDQTKMFVNGKYIPKSHPLHKPGRYKNFEAAAFSSLAKYESSVEGQVYVDRKSTRLNSSHGYISYAVFCLKKKNNTKKKTNKILSPSKR